MVPFILFMFNVKNPKKEKYERKSLYKIILNQFFGTWTVIIGRG